MSYSLRPAKRSEAKPLIGLYSESGSGKTWSALMLARGFVGPKGKIAMIETEAGRGEVYADVLPGGYHVCSMRDTFSPENYGEAIKAVEQERADALIIDSASHEWEGSGGVLAMAAENEVAGKKSLMIWQGPKLAHQRYFVLRLLATPIPLVIVCMRAKYPMKELKVDGKKEWARADDLAPVQSDGILYELMIHGWIDREHRFRGTKYTRDDLRAVLKDGEPISIATGERLAAWAKEVAPAAPAAPTGPAPAKPAPKRAAPTQQAAPPSAPSTTGNGAEHPLFADAERESALAALRLTVDSMGKRPPDDAWKALCREVCGTEDFEHADPAAIAELHQLMKDVKAKLKPAVDRANSIVLRARAAARAS